MTTQSEAWIPSDTFARRLVDIRHEKRLTVEQAAEATGLSPATWSTWERGAKPQKMDVVVAKIALGLRVNRDWLMWGEQAALTAGEGSSATTARYPLDSLAVGTAA